MKIELSQTPFLSPQQIGELASSLDAIYQRVLKTIDRLQKDVDARKAEISARWKSAGISMEDKHLFAEKESFAAIATIKQNASKELDRFYKEAGPVHHSLIAQRLYYDSPVKVLGRSALGTSQRSAYLEQLAHAGPVELGNMAQLAIGTKNAALAAAVLSVLDAMPSKERPISPAQLATAMELEEYIKVREYLKIGEARLQGIVLAIRSWQHGRANPINTLSLALDSRNLDLSVLERNGD